MYSLGLALVIFTLVGLGMLLFVLVLSWAVRPFSNRESAQYECGYPAKGDARAIGFNYLSYAALFLVFELAALYLFLFSIQPFSRGVGLSFLFGLATLALMILYATKKRRYHVA